MTLHAAIPGILVTGFVWSTELFAPNPEFKRKGHFFCPEAFAGFRVSALGVICSSGASQFKLWGLGFRVFV